MSFFLTDYLAYIWGLIYSCSIIFWCFMRLCALINRFNPFFIKYICLHFFIITFLLFSCNSSNFYLSFSSKLSKSFNIYFLFLLPPLSDPLLSCYFWNAFDITAYVSWSRKYDIINVRGQKKNHEYLLYDFWANFMLYVHPSNVTH